ncbi:uncharacterized protein LOC135366001 [Ornithodoros turicata]|uniref:uncharacterized protein LOC135366001 n=1 Tax=Ornithodoros turicata TaxID=34597 RepID=UPI00313927FB
MNNDRSISPDEPSGHQLNEKGLCSLWTSCPSKKPLLTLITGAAFYVLMLLAFLQRPRTVLPLPQQRAVHFYGVDNYTGFNSYVVPNIVHYVRFGHPEMSFMEAVGMRSAYINQAPDQIVVHCDVCRLRGPYSYWIRDIPVIKFNKRPPPKSIYGRNLSWIGHASDIARVQILLRNGGIYLDNDCIVIQPMHQFRHFETSIGWPPKEHMGNMVFVATPGARFLQLYQELYRWYDRSLWYYNARALPTMRLLWPHPHLVHQVPVLFGVQRDLLGKLYSPGEHIDWRSYFAVHTSLGYRSLTKGVSYQKVDFKNVRTHNTSLGEIIREVLFGTSAFVSDSAEVKPVTELYAAKRLRSKQGSTIRSSSGRRLRKKVDRV